MLILLLEVPHRGDPRVWTADDLADYCQRTYAAANHSHRAVWERITPREMLDTYGYPSFAAPANPDDDDDLWRQARELASKHGADTTLYRAGWLTGDDWQTEAIAEADACDAFNGSDLSAFYRMGSPKECRELLERLEGPNAPRIGLCGPVAAAAVLRREAKEMGWLPEPEPEDETELDFLNDLNALISQALDGEVEPVKALRTLADEVRERIDTLEEAAGA